MKVWNIDSVSINTINIFALMLVFNIFDDCYNIMSKAY